MRDTRPSNRGGPSGCGDGVGLGSTEAAGEGEGAPCRGEAAASPAGAATTGAPTGSADDEHADSDRATHVTRQTDRSTSPIVSSHPATRPKLYTWSERHGEERGPREHS
jgi:hypothetical protein